jgi:hypothetical protein
VIEIPPPHGYRRSVVDGVELVAHERFFDEMRGILDGGVTLHEYAAASPAARPLGGRAVAYATVLPQSGSRVVVRHNQHGGLLAGLTADRFRPPTRAPRELRMSLHLAASGVPTVAVVGFATYPASPFFRRADVVTAELFPARDLASYLDDTDMLLRASAIAAAVPLVHALSEAGLWHQDLNAKNVLIYSPPDAAPYAVLLDVDRVDFVEHAYLGGTALTRNARRLARSMRKWRDRWGAKVTETEIAAFERAVRTASAPAPSTTSDTAAPPDPS